MLTLQSTYTIDSTKLTPSIDYQKELFIHALFPTLKPTVTDQNKEECCAIKQLINESTADVDSARFAFSDEILAAARHSSAYACLNIFNDESLDDIKQIVSFTTDAKRSTQTYQLTIIFNGQAVSYASALHDSIDDVFENLYSDALIRNDSA